MDRTKNPARLTGNFTRLKLSSDTRAVFNDLLTEAPRLGLDPASVAAAGLPGLRALLALKLASESTSKAKRDGHLAQLQGTLGVLQYRKHPALVQQFQARAMALQGRGGDTEVAHVTVGEIVLPKALQTRAVLAALGQAAGEAGIPLAHLRVGSGRNSINPRTGQPEFFDDSDEDPSEDPSEEPSPEQPSPQEPPSETSSSDPPIEEITVTAPRETGLVQFPQDLPGEFRIYANPGGGVDQYGTPAAMGVIGAASHAWTASGRAPFSVGDMSNSSGTDYGPHRHARDHTNGLGIDIRPIRKDGKDAHVDYKSPDYDRAATQKLVDMLRATGGVTQILFNDPEIKGVTPYTKDGGHSHDFHLHVQVDPNYRRPPGR